MRLPVSLKVTDDEIGKSRQREILAQMNVWKTQDCCMYFAFSKLHSWAKISAEGRRQFHQRLQNRRFPVRFLSCGLRQHARECAL